MIPAATAVRLPLVDMGAGAAAASGGGDEGASDSPSDSSGEGDGETQNGSDEGGDSDAPASHDPSGTGEIMDAGARGDRNAGDGEAPVDVTAEEQAWDEAMHQAMNLARAEGKLPGGGRGDGAKRPYQHPRLADPLAPLHDRRSARRL